MRFTFRFKALGMITLTKQQGLLNFPQELCAAEP